MSRTRRDTDEDPGAREAQRLSALSDYRPASDLGDAALDELVRLAAQLCGTPIALVTLLGADRQDFAASVGLEPVGTSREVAFCAHAIEAPREALVVADATADARFAGNPLVLGDPGIRFYAGIPLVTDDQQALGTLCVIDVQPRELSDVQLAQLRALSRAAMGHLEARRARLELERQRRFTDAVLETIDTPVVACDAAGDLTLFNRAARELYGVDADAVGVDEGASRYDLFEADGVTPMVQERIPLLRAFDGQEVGDQQMVVHRHGSDPRTLSASGRQILDADGGKLGAVVAMHDLTARLVEERARRKADQLFLTAFDAAPIGMVMVAPDGRFRRSNDAISTITGYSQQELAQLPPFHFVHPEDADMVRARFAGVGGDSVEVTHRILRADGRTAWVEARMTMMVDEDGAPQYALAQVNDISERHLAQQQLAEQHAFISAVVETADSLVIVLDRAGHITKFNRACELLTGRATGTTEGRLFWEVLLPEDEVEATRAAFGDIVAGDFPHHYVNHWRTTAGETRLIEWRSTALVDDVGQVTHIVGTGIDVTERRRFEDQLRHMADHDPLTGLVNRRFFESALGDHLAHCQRYGARGALLVLDVDGFKAVNDALGHSAGDDLLISIASALRMHLRETDTIARLGGDEFAVLLSEPDAGEARSVADKVVTLVRDQVGAEGLQVTASVGVRLLTPDTDLTARQVGCDADLAMYDAKQAGGDRHAVFGARAESTETPLAV